MTKILTALAASILLQPALASANEVCAKFMPCGTFEGTGRWYKTDGTPESAEDYNEKIVIKPEGIRSVRVDVYIYSGPEPKRWSSLRLSFDSKGAFSKRLKDGSTANTGVCANNVCTVAFHPVAVKKNEQTFVNSFVNILRFEGDKLTRYNMVANNSDDSDLHFQRSHLVKK